MRNLAKFFRRRAREISRFRAACRGATAVEFAIVMPVFLAALIALFETTLFVFAQENLQNAAVEAGRLFLTGQAQNSNMTQAQFNTAICPMIQVLFNCNNLMVDVQSYASFGGATVTPPTLTYNAQGQVTNSWAYTMGAQGSIMVVRLIYQWPIVGGPFGYVLSNLGNGTTEMMGVSAFRVEPY